MIFNRSITAKFLAALFVILLIGQSLGALIMVFSTRSALFDSLENRMKREASIAAGVSKGPLQSLDYAPIDAYLEEIMRDEDITAIHILDLCREPFLQEEPLLQGARRVCRCQDRRSGHRLFDEIDKQEPFR
jgi:hypothetical protein